MSSGVRGRRFGDCPALLDVLIVHDLTTGGPHRGALDNGTVAADGNPTGMVFADNPYATD